MFENRLTTSPEAASYYKQALTSTSTTQKEIYLGVRRAVEGTTGTKTYRYVKATAKVIKGDVVHCSSAASPTTVAKAASESNSNLVLGVAITTIAANSFGYIQDGGVCTNVRTDKAVKAKDLLKKDQATAGMADTVVASVTQTHKIFGIALASDSGSFCPAVLLGIRYGI